MKVLFATTNPAKIEYYYDQLKKKGIELLIPKDLNLELEVEETGTDAIENAIIKARAFHEATGLTTIAMDDTLFIEGLPDEEQPKTHVRRVNGKRLNDVEMIEHYTSIAKKLGGQANGYWLHGVAVCKDGNVNTYDVKSYNTFLQESSSVVTEGYPLDSISIVPKYNKYRSELTEEERNVERLEYNQKLYEFVASNI